jgi:hypothetical protein
MRFVCTKMESMMARIRFALRSLAKAPLLSLVVVLSLGLGIGANTAIFSLFHQVILSSLPVDPHSATGRGFPFGGPKCSDTASRTFSRSSSQVSASVKMAWPSARAQ